MELHYYNIKGRPEPIRFMLAYLKMDYKEVTVQTIDEWKKEKEQQVSEGVLFPNLPYLKDGAEILTETEAIALYIAQKAKRQELFSKEVDRILFIQIKGIYQDMAMKMAHILYSTEYEKVIDQCQEFFKHMLLQLERFVSGKDHLLPYLTYLDFQFYALMDMFKKMATHSKLENTLNECPNFTRILQNVEQLDGVKQYLENDERWKRPYMFAKFVKCPKEFIE